MHETPDAPLLELRGITKRFGDLVANDSVDLEVARGEVHALLGENGAGKSTLMNVLYGLTAPDSGEIRFDGKPLRLRSPRDAIDVGIGMVHQHFMLIPVMTVTENIVLAAEPREGPLLDYGKAHETVRDLSERYGLAVRPDERVESIGVAQQQRVEILKALYRSARLLVLDEPTAVLTPQETHELFGVVRSLKEQGTSIIFITHKLGEVLEIADRITVLRRGKAMATVPAAGTSERELAELMVGRPVLLRVDKGAAQPGETLLEVRDLVVHDSRGLEAVRGRHSRSGRARSSALPASTGTARVSWSRRSPVSQSRRAAPSSPRAERSPATAPGPASRPASATSRRTASGAGSCSSSRSPRTSACATSATRPPRASGCSIPARSPSALGGCSASSTSAAAGRARGRATSPAGISRRS